MTWECRDDMTICLYVNWATAAPNIESEVKNAMI